MYAIFVDGGRQYKVEQGQVLDLPYREAKAGDQLTFEQVLAVGGEGNVKLGSPKVAGASVSVECLGTSQGQKLDIQKLRRRKNMRRKTGHRSVLTRVKVTAISG